MCRADVSGPMFDWLIPLCTETGMMLLGYNGQEAADLHNVRLRSSVKMHLLRCRGHYRPQRDQGISDLC